MDLIRVITLQTLQYNFAFTATHIPGLDNSIADSLSHFRWTTPVPWLPQPPPSLHQRWTPEFLYSDIFMLTLPLPLDAPIKLASSTSSPLTSRMVFVMYHAMLWMALRGFKMQWILFAMANSTSVHLTSNDITLVPNSHSSSNMQVHIKQSKPDPFRQGYTTTIAKSSSPICSVVAMKDYLLQAQPPSSHPLFHRTILQQSLGQFFNTVVSLSPISTPPVFVLEPPQQQPKLPFHSGLLKFSGTGAQIVMNVYKNT